MNKCYIILIQCELQPSFLLMSSSDQHRGLESEVYKSTCETIILPVLMTVVKILEIQVESTICITKSTCWYSHGNPHSDKFQGDF